LRDVLHLVANVLTVTGWRNRHFKNSWHCYAFWDIETLFDWQQL